MIKTLVKVAKYAISTVAVLAGLFFGAIGIVALVTKQDYVVVMNTAFDWFKGLSNN